MIDNKKLCRELAMYSALAMTIIDALKGQNSNVPSTVANNFVIAYRQLPSNSFKTIVQKVADEI